MLTRYWFPLELTVEQAYVRAQSISIRTPLSGTVVAIHARQGQLMRTGGIVAIVEPTIPEENYGEMLVITAPFDGVITDIQPAGRQILQAAEQIATLIRTDPDTMEIVAHWKATPKLIAEIQQWQPAIVRADFLNGGKDIEAHVSSVHPVFDTDDKLLKVYLKMKEEFHSSVPVVSGMPVQAKIMIENPSAFRKIVYDALHEILPNVAASSVVR